MTTVSVNLPVNTVIGIKTAIDSILHVFGFVCLNHLYSSFLVRLIEWLRSRGNNIGFIFASDSIVHILTGVESLTPETVDEPRSTDSSTNTDVWSTEELKNDADVDFKANDSVKSLTSASTPHRKRDRFNTSVLGIKMLADMIHIIGLVTLGLVIASSFGINADVKIRENGEKVYIYSFENKTHSTDFPKDHYIIRADPIAREFELEALEDCIISKHTRSDEMSESVFIDTLNLQTRVPFDPYDLGREAEGDNLNVCSTEQVDINIRRLRGLNTIEDVYPTIRIEQVSKCLASEITLYDYWENMIFMDSSGIITCDALVENRSERVNLYFDDDTKYLYFDSFTFPAELFPEIPDYPISEFAASPMFSWRLVKQLDEFRIMVNPSRTYNTLKLWFFYMNSYQTGPTIIAEDDLLAIGEYYGGFGKQYHDGEHDNLDSDNDQNPYDYGQNPYDDEENPRILLESDGQSVRVGGITYNLGKAVDRSLRHCILIIFAAHCYDSDNQYAYGHIDLPKRWSFEVDRAHMFSDENGDFNEDSYWEYIFHRVNERHDVIALIMVDNTTVIPSHMEYDVQREGLLFRENVLFNAHVPLDSNRYISRSMYKGDEKAYEFTGYDEVTVFDMYSLVINIFLIALSCICILLWFVFLFSHPIKELSKSTLIQLSNPTAKFCKKGRDVLLIPRRIGNTIQVSPLVEDKEIQDLENMENEVGEEKTYIEKQKDMKDVLKGGMKNV